MNDYHIIMSTGFNEYLAANKIEAIVHLHTSNFKSTTDGNTSTRYWYTSQESNLEPAGANQIVPILTPHSIGQDKSGTPNSDTLY